MNIAAFIDHTLLRPTTTTEEIAKLCQEAKDEGFAAVCVPPHVVKLAREQLRGTLVKTATVIGFPFGYNIIDTKLLEIKEAIRDGADELDVVHNISALKSGEWNYLEEEVRQCTRLAHASGKIIKVILESGSLEDAELIQCCRLYAQINVDYLKTSTGYSETGVTTRTVRIMRQHLPASVSIKASGGIRNFTFAKELIEAGANRLGCSASLKILQESKKEDVA